MKAILKVILAIIGSLVFGGALVFMVHSTDGPVWLMVLMGAGAVGVIVRGLYGGADD